MHETWARSSDGQRQDPYPVVAHVGGYGAGRLERGDPDVVGHQHRAGPDRRGAGAGVRRAGTEVGFEAALLGRGEGQAAQVRQAAGAPAVQRSVEKARHIQFGGQPVGEPVSQLEGGREVVWWPFARHVGDEGHDVERTQPGVDALVAAQVDQVDRGPGQRSGGLGHDVGRPGQGEDRTVVVGVTVEVDQGRGGGLGEPAEHRVVPAFRDIGHALHELDRHHSSVTLRRHGAGRRGPRGPLGAPRPGEAPIRTGGPWS